MENQKTWIRVAGHAANIKANQDHPWRCYIKGSPTEIGLKGWSLSGTVSKKNYIPGVASAGDVHGLVAWIDCFGSYEVKDEVLHIALAEPTK